MASIVQWRVAVYVAFWAQLGVLARIYVDKLFQVRIENSQLGESEGQNFKMSDVQCLA